MGLPLEAFLRLGTGFVVGKEQRRRENELIALKEKREAEKRDRSKRKFIAESGLSLVDELSQQGLELTPEFAQVLAKNLSTIFDQEKPEVLRGVQFQKSADPTKRELFEEEKRQFETREERLSRETSTRERRIGKSLETEKRGQDTLILRGLSQELDDLRLQKREVDKVAAMSNTRLVESGLTEQDRGEAKRRARELQRQIEPRRSQRQALLKRLGVPETRESRELEKTLQVEGESTKAFDRLMKRPAIRDKIKVLKSNVNKGLMTRQRAIESFAGLFSESIRRGVVSKEQFRALVQKFDEQL